jgi:kynureninase
MGKRTIRGAAFAVTLAILAVVVAQPVLADTELGHTGTVGVHSLRDSSSEYGASCKYRYLPAYDFGQLRRVYVFAPRVRAVTGHSSQLVGWKFTIQRRTVWLDGPGPWKNRFTSTEQMAMTSDSAYAPFTERSASVDVPFGPDENGAAAQYRGLHHHALAPL